MTRKALFLSLALSVALSAASVVPAFSVPRSHAAQVPAEDAKNRIQEAFDLLYQLHLSAPSKDKLAEAAIRGMVESLNDPYTVYWTKEEYRRFLESLNGQYVGLGIVIENDGGRVRVSEVMPGRPGEAAGLRAGDLIVSIDGKSVDFEHFDEVRASWKAGQKVRIGVERGGARLELEAVLAEVELPRVTGSRVADGIGYVRLTSFAEKTDEQLRAKLAELGNLRALVLDLRGNTGGLLSSAGDVASRFVGSGVLLYTRDQSGVEEKVEFSGVRAFAGRLIVLVDEQTASAAEILAGALQDYGVARVVGVRTYGKGVVQQIYPLGSGDAYLKITVEEYLTPKHRQVNGRGIQPDLVVVGEGAQLATALREAGVESLRLEASEGVCRIMGLDCGGPTPIVRDGRTYVPLRTLAALVGATVTWIGETRTARVVAGGVTVDFAAGGELRLENGVGYADVETFLRKFSGVKWLRTPDGAYEVTAPLSSRP